MIPAPVLVAVGLVEGVAQTRKQRHLVPAENYGQVALMRQPDEPARQVRAVERVDEEEAQRRHDAVHRRHRNAVRLLLDLEPAQIVGGRRVR